MLLTGTSLPTDFFTLIDGGEAVGASPAPAVRVRLARAGGSVPVDLRYGRAAGPRVELRGAHVCRINR